MALGSLCYLPGSLFGKGNNLVIMRYAALLIFRRKGRQVGVVFLWHRALSRSVEGRERARKQSWPRSPSVCGPAGTHRGPSSPAAPVPTPACARPPVCERAGVCASGAGETFPLGMGNRAGAVDMEVGERGEDPRLMTVLVRHKNVAGRRRKREVLSVCAPVGRRVSSACRHGQRLKPDARNAQYAPPTHRLIVFQPRSFTVCISFRRQTRALPVSEPRRKFQS